MDREINFLENKRNRIKKKRSSDNKEKVEWTSPEKLIAPKEEALGGLFGGWKEILTGLMKKSAGKDNNNQPAKTPAINLMAGAKNYPEGRSAGAGERRINKTNELEERMLLRKKEITDARDRLLDKEKINSQKEINYLNRISKAKKGEARLLSGLMKKFFAAISSFSFLKTGKNGAKIRDAAVGAGLGGSVPEKSGYPFQEKEAVKKNFISTAPAGLPAARTEPVGGKKDNIPGEGEVPEFGGWAGESFKGTNLIKERISLSEIKKRSVITFCLVVLSFLFVGAGYYTVGLWEKNKIGEKMALVKEAEKLANEKKVKEEDLSEVFAFEKKLQYVKLLLDRHVYFTNLFSFLEKNTLESVYYLNFSGDNGGAYELNATAKDFKNIAKQIESLKANPLVKEVSTGGGEYDGGEGNSGGGQEKTAAAGINFILKIALDKSIFFNSPE